MWSEPLEKNAPKRRCKTGRKWCKMSRTASRTSLGGLQDLGKLRIAGVALIFLTGLIHLLVIPEYFGFAAYLGLLIFADFVGSMVSAGGIYQGREWGWWLGVVMAGGAFWRTSRAGRWGCQDYLPGSHLRSRRASSLSSSRRPL